MDAHEGAQHHRNAGRMPAGGSNRLRPSSETAHHIHHKIAWKAISIDARHVIFRCDGVCKDDPKYNVHTLGDPRNPLTRFRNVESVDLPLPSFVLDNNSVGPQPKREVSIFGLNDNINRAFLSDMCQKTGRITEVFVYMHPRTKKHLGMAYVVFQDAGKAESFVAKNNGTSVMGQTITCIVDPYANEISQRYEERAMEAAPIPHYLSRLDYNRLTEFRKVSSTNTSECKGIITSSSTSFNAQQSTDVKASEPPPKKEPEECEAAVHHDKGQQIHQQSVEAVLTKTANAWPRTKTVAPTLAQPQVIVANSVPTTSNFVSATYQAVPSTSFCEEVAPMDPAPSKESEERQKPKTITSTQRKKRTVPANGKMKVRKRRRLRESISNSSASGSSNLESNERSELSEEGSVDSNSSSIKRKHRHRKKGIMEARKYYMKQTAGGTNDYYKEIVIRKNDSTRKCSHETKSNLLQSPELVEEVESYQHIRKYKERQPETTMRDEPDVDLPDLESVSSDDQLTAEQQELKVQPAAKNGKKSGEMIQSRQQQLKHVDWRKKRIMEKRRSCDHKDYKDLESSNVRGNEKGHRWSSSSSSIESETECDEPTCFKICKKIQGRLSILHSPKSSKMDMVEAVTASSEESHGEETGTSSTAHQLIAPLSLTKNDSAQSLPNTGLITSPEKLSGDSPLPCVMQSTPPAESSRPSFERRLENLFRSTSIQPPVESLTRFRIIEIIETHEEELSNDACGTSIPSISGFDTPFLLSNAASNAVELKEIPSPEAVSVHSRKIVTTKHSPATKSWANSQPYATENSTYCDATSDSIPFEISTFSPTEANTIKVKEATLYLDKTGRQNELIDHEVEVRGRSKESEEQKDSEEQIIERKKARENYVHAVYVAVREDLKSVLLKDLMRKIESIAFEKLEQGWNERVKVVERDDDSMHNEAKDDAIDDPTLTIDKTNVPSVKKTVSSKDSLNEVVRQVTEQTRAEISAAFGPDTASLLGTGLFFKGLGIARNMPSFKKKQVRLSPKRKQRSRSSSCRSSCLTYSYTRSDRTPESSRSCERSESQNRRSESTEETTSDDEDTKSENERSTSESGSAYSISRSSRTFSRRHSDSETFISNRGSASEEDEEDEVDEDEEEEEEDEELEEQEHAKKDFSGIQANKLSARSGIGEKAMLLIKTEIEGKTRCGRTDLSSCTTPSHLIEQAGVTEELQARHEKVLGVANIEGYFNDHCYLPMELSEQLKKELEESVSVCSDSETMSSEKPDDKLLQHAQDKTARIKKRCYRNELASLLPPPVDVEQLAWETSWKPAKQWEKRTAEEEKMVFWKFGKEGLDAEDLTFLEKAFHEMQNDGTATWNRKLYWVPPRKIPEIHVLDKPKKIGKNIYYYDDPELEGVVPHSSGCARTEGYYKLSHKEKKGVLRRPDVFLTEISEKDDEKARYLIQSTREARSMNRRLLTSMGDTSSDIFKFRKKLIKFARSRIHGWGLYALEAIAPDEMIVEYIGQKIRPTVADEREKRYERRGMGSSYLFRIDSDNVIDATQMGNLARFINHSCQPNCYAKIVVVDGEKRIVIYSKLAINKGDEITYDYKFPIEEDKIDCLCGAPGCRGSLN
ncbi:unnamed protein product [Litomosoides sigmodontis]|uniref:[histone H3]-lysine(4) N-trimethyltransferase n=1 Tax=Litomosoides sigmodontis TaxID=42156 RepID=A0A3P6S7G7_LITSI|nr:unnamed protein product [Litomosoides sigmodontis]